MIPEGHTIEDIKTRERIIRMVSIVETSEHAAKSYLSTLAAMTIGFHFDLSQKSICQEAETRQCESETIRAYYDNGI